jgi:soluble lytic murein transglycosylase-like protein
VSMKSLILMLMLGVLPASAMADIYSYTDAKGVLHFSNVPDNSQYQLILATQGGGGRQKEVTSDNRVQPSRAGKDRFAPIVEEAARDHQVDPALLHAVITAESGYNPDAVSRKGAVGLMQLMPETARRYGVENSFDPTQNIQGGTKYLSDLLQMFNNNLELAVAAYNAGENAVIRHGYSIPPYRETLAYVPKVLKLQKKYRSVL